MIYFGIWENEGGSSPRVPADEIDFQSLFRSLNHQSITIRDWDRTPWMHKVDEDGVYKK